MVASASMDTMTRSSPSLSKSRAVGQSASQPALPTVVQRNRLTPRSAEACRRTGIEPSELLPLPREAFREAGQEPALEKKRWEWYETMRVEAYQTVRAERERINKEQGKNDFVGNAVLVASRGPGKLQHAAKADSSPQAKADEAARQAESAAEAAELRAIEKIKKKQQAEIEQMLMFEIRSAQLQSEKQEKQMLVEASDKREKAERQARQLAAAEHRKQQELERRDAEVAAEREARRRQRADMEREVRRKAAEEEAERQRLLELDKKERARIAKQQARRDRQVSLMKEQQDAAYAKQKADEEREQARLDRLEESQQKQLEEMMAQRERASRRIALTMQMKEERVDQLRKNYVHKLQGEEQRRAEFEANKQATIEARKRAGAEKAAHIQEVQQMMEMTVEARKNEIIGREREHMEMKAKADMERERVLEVAASEKEMRMYSRQLKMARHQRRDEYRREVVAAKIAMEGQRTENLLDKKSHTLQRRREMNSANALARQVITERLDKMKSSNVIDVDEQFTDNISNYDLKELLHRCQAKTGGSTKVSIETMRHVLAEMQAEGRLGGLGGKGDRPKSH